MSEAEIDDFVRAIYGAPYEDNGNCELCNASGPTWMITSGEDTLPFCVACIAIAQIWDETK